MKHVLLATAAALALAVAPAAAQQKTVKIGFIGTFSGAAAALGNDMRNSFEVGLDHAGRKLGGLPVEVIYEDDQIKPEVGVQKTQKLIESDRVDFLVGYIWSNVLLGVAQAGDRQQDLPDHHQRRSVADRGRALLALCFSTSWQNDQRPAAVGTYLTKKGFKTLFTDRAELRRRQGPDRRASSRITKARWSARSSPAGRTSSTSRRSSPRSKRGEARCRSSRSIRARPDAVPDPVHPGRAQGRDPALHRPRWSTKCRCRTRRTWRLACSASRSGATTWITPPTRDTWRTTRRSTKPIRPLYGAQTYDAVALIDSAHQSRQWRSLQEGRDAPGHGEGRFQVGARRLQVRQEPRAGAVVLSAELPKSSMTATR